MALTKSGNYICLEKGLGENQMSSCPVYLYILRILSYARYLSFLVNILLG